MKRTEQDFILATSAAPERDDLARASCEKAGQPGHFSCGWCENHDKPRWICGPQCFKFPPNPSHNQGDGAK